MVATASAVKAARLPGKFPSSSTNPMLFARARLLRERNICQFTENKAMTSRLGLNLQCTRGVEEIDVKESHEGNTR